MDEAAQSTPICEWVAHLPRGVPRAPPAASYRATENRNVRDAVLPDVLAIEIVTL
jgi:hypothetical protein